MSLSILHELDHPKHPLSLEERGDVLEGAQLGSRIVGLDPGVSYLEAMSREPLLNPGNREFFVGYSIGVRAGVMDLGVAEEEDSGFQVSGKEMSVLRTSRGMGALIEWEHRSALTSFPDILQTTAWRAQEDGKGLTDDERIKLEKPIEAAFIGVAIGVRYAQLSRAGRIAA